MTWFQSEIDCLEDVIQWGDEESEGGSDGLGFRVNWRATKMSFSGEMNNLKVEEQYGTKNCCILWFVVAGEGEELEQV